MSQPSSPIHSRTGSPTRSQQQQQSSQPTTNQNTQQQAVPPQRRGLRSRPSAETTPPPLQQQATNTQQSSQQTQGGTINYMGNDIMVQTIKNFDEVSFVEKAHKHKMLKTRFNSKDN